ncbi:hypothetical protein [Shimia thalassica]|uniref:hypothetical protein n=1 Tax=Shimia thalassica TaxID=1715693 RepID=UPI0026E32379|nr:hypothetical protein [Shimia thalassica]MDO6799722.1 hypothetical protein [Shimia thalassica]
MSKLANEMVGLATRTRVRSKLLNKTQYLSPVSFKTCIRSLVNERHDMDFEVSRHNSDFRELNLSLNENSELFASQHAFLGNAEDALKKQALFPRTEKRIRRISQLFEKDKLSVHLSICSQVDFLCDALNPEQQYSLSASQVQSLSWVELLKRIRNGNPEAEIIVWDFERPTVVTISFLALLTNCEPEQLRKLLGGQITQTISSYTTKYKPQFRNDTEAALDELYGLDLSLLEEFSGEHENVHFISEEKVPDDFKL